MRARVLLAVSFAIAVAMAVFASLPAATASTGALSGPHSDRGLDTDAPANGLFDWLVVSVGATVTVPGGFLLIVQLYDGTGVTGITAAQKIVNLPAGPSLTDVRLSGGAIRTSGIDGPYQARIVLLNDTIQFQDVGIHVTGAYLATDFDPAAAVLAPPHADVGVDSDSPADGLFDYLAVDVSVSVAKAGVYTVTGDLTDEPPSVFIASARNSTWLAAGTDTVRLRFSGQTIRASAVNGPYNVSLFLYSAAGPAIDQGYHVTTGTYFISDFDALAASFTPPHESFTVDLDADTFYDYLVVNAIVTVRTPGTYRMTASLPGVGLASTWQGYLSAGIQVVQADFLGVEIFNAGVDGPYTVDLALYDLGRTLDRDTFTTANYLATDFEPSPPARWVPPTTDSARDDQPDGFWDYLVINATVTAERHGRYDWGLDLWDVSFGVYIGSAYGELDLVTGINPVQMLFPGVQIAMSGIDGPYGVDMFLSDDTGRQVDATSYTTGAYLASDFDPVPAQLTPPYLDLGLDRDTPPDGILDILAIDVPVTVTAANTFALFVTLLDPGLSFAGYASVIADLTPGLHTVRVMVPAADAFHSGQDAGAFYGGLSLSVMKRGGPIQIDSDSFITRNYTAGPFDQGAPLRLSGRVSETTSIDPPTGANVLAWSPTTRLLRQADVDASGRYEMWLPAGDYVVIADSPAGDAAGVNQTISADTALDFALGPPAAQSIVGTVSFAGWDSATLTGDFGFGSDAVAMRYQVDAGFGNGDGFASQAELDRIVLFGEPPSLPWSTRDMFTVDGTEYRRVNGTEMFTITGAGPVVSGVPITAALSGGFASASPIPRASRHTGRFLADYDTREEMQAFTLVWPATYALAAATPAPAVTVTGFGTPSSGIDPAADPNPRDFERDVWLDLTVDTTDALSPLVTNPALNGLTTFRTRTGPTVTVTATVSDAGRGDWEIAGANVTRGAGNWPGIPLAAADGTFDQVTEDVTGTIPTVGLTEGGHSICVYAWDVVPNYGTTGACASLIIDDTPPAVTNVRINGQATRTVVVGASVTLTATASDGAGGGSAIAEANYTRTAAAWPGTAMSAVDGAFDEVVEDLTATIDTTGWTAGTYAICVYAKDSVGNDDPTGTVCAQLVVLAQDVSDPAVSDLRATPDPADPGQAVDLSAIVTDNVDVTAVYIEIFDGTGASVENLTATYDTATGRYSVTHTARSGGAYTYRVSARDAAGNWATASGSFSVTGAPTPGPGLPDYWWVALVIVAAVVVIAVLLWLRRKKARPMAGPTAAPVPPAPPGPESPPPPSGAQTPPPEIDELDRPMPPPP